MAALVISVPFRPASVSRLQTLTPSANIPGSHSIGTAMVRIFIVVETAIDCKSRFNRGGKTSHFAFFTLILYLLNPFKATDDSSDPIWVAPTSAALVQLCDKIETASDVPDPG